MEDKKENKSDKLKKAYDILDTDAATTNEIPEGFTGIFLFIEGDVKDLRIICLN